MLKHYKPATQGKAEKELQNMGKDFHFGENFTRKLHNIPGDAKSKIPKLSLPKLVVFCSWVYFSSQSKYFLVLWLPKVGKTIYKHMGTKTHIRWQRHISAYSHKDTYLHTLSLSHRHSLTWRVVNQYLYWVEKNALYIYLVAISELSQ